MEKQHKIVTLTYELYVDNHLFETVTADHPLVYCSGADMLLPKFEESLEGLNDDDTFDFTLTPDEAYGQHDDKLILDIDKHKFEIDGKIDEKIVYDGAIVPLLTQDGGRVTATILKIEDKTIRIDLNHPMAGKSLHYVGTVQSVRPASDDEVKLFTQSCGGCCAGGCGGKGNCQEGCEGGCENGCGGCD